MPRPQALTDIPVIIARQMDAKDIAQMIIDQLAEMLEQTRASNALAAARDAAIARCALTQ